jgi:hypothetical protein
MTAAILGLGEITVVWADYVGSDWVAIYLNGDRVYEGHPPNADDAFRAVGIAAEDRTFPSDNLLTPGRRGFPLRLPKETDQ